MSCNRRSLQASQAALAAGLSSLNSRLGYTTGLMFGAATRAMDRVGQAIAPAATLALRLLEPTNAQAAQKQAVAGRLAGAAVAVGASLVRLTPLLVKIRLAAGLSEVVTRKAGTALAALSETGQTGTVVTEQQHFGFFKSKQPVVLKRSSLTAWLNRPDVMGQREVMASKGVLFTVGGKTWHRGTVTFTVGQNRRTVTHLQSLSYPAEHYYLDRTLSNRQAVALARGQARPETLPGFVGRISKAENLCPAWAETKRALILTRLHWGEKEG